MPEYNVKSLDELVSRIKDDVLREASQQIIGTDPSLFQEELKGQIAVNFMNGMYKSFLKHSGNITADDKYSKKWFASEGLTGGNGGNLGHLFSDFFAFGINNSRPPSMENFFLDAVGNVAEEGETLLQLFKKREAEAKKRITQRLGFGTSAMTSSTVIMKNKMELGKIEEQVKKVMKMFATGNSYAYYAKTSGRIRYNIRDIDFYTGVNSSKVETLIESKLIKMAKVSNSKNESTQEYTFRFTIKDVDLIRFLYDNKTHYETWQEAWKAGMLGIIVHEEASDSHRVKFNK